MAITALIIPTQDQLIAMNKNTRDGNGSVFKQEDLACLLKLECSYFEFAIEDLNDPVEMGLTFAYYIGDGHLFVDGNKSTATQAFKFILEKNGKSLLPSLAEKDLIEIINSLVEGEGASEVIPAALERVRPYVV